MPINSRVGTNPTHWTYLLLEALSLPYRSNCFHCRPFCVYLTESNVIISKACAKLSNNVHPTHWLPCSTAALPHHHSLITSQSLHQWAEEVVVKCSCTDDLFRNSISHTRHITVTSKLIFIIKSVVYFFFQIRLWLWSLQSPVHQSCLSKRWFGPRKNRGSCKMHRIR